MFFFNFNISSTAQGKYKLNLVKIIQITLCLTMLVYVDGYSQEISIYETLSYKELERLQQEASDNKNLDELRKLSKAQYRKATNEKDTLKMASSYHYRLLDEDLRTSLMLSDSIIRLTENLKSDVWPGAAHLYKGYRQYNAGLYSEALENYILANDYAVKNNNNYQIDEALSAIASIKNIHGFHSEALDIYERLLKHLPKNKESDDYDFEKHTLLLYNISLAHLRLFSIDSARAYVLEGMSEAIANKDKSLYNDFVMVNAQIDYYDGNFLKARDTLEKYVKEFNLEETPDKVYYLGQIAEKLGDTTTKLEYFKKIDSMVSISNKSIDNIKLVYNDLLVEAMNNENKEKQIHYIERLLFFDSILNLNSLQVNNLATLGFDVPMLKREKKQLQSELKSKANNYIVIVWIAVLFLITSSFFAVRYIMVSKRLNKLINSEVKTIETIKPNRELKTVSSEVVQRIEQGLARFEKEKSYLEPDLTQEGLAKELDTNSTYLSKVINHNKGINFSTYLKDLRITNAINTLNATPKIAEKYTIGGLAEIFGFKSADSFSRALVQKTGVNASSYLRKISK